MTRDIFDLRDALSILQFAVWSAATGLRVGRVQ